MDASLARLPAAAADVDLFGPRMAWLEGDRTSLAEDDAILTTQDIKASPSSPYVSRSESTSMGRTGESRSNQASLYVPCRTVLGVSLRSPGTTYAEGRSAGNRYASAASSFQSPPSANGDMVHTKEGSLIRRDSSGGSWLCSMSRIAQVSFQMGDGHAQATASRDTSRCAVHYLVDGLISFAAVTHSCLTTTQCPSIMPK